jgi:DNA-binding IscR family transcriptional regulator
MQFSIALHVMAGLGVLDGQNTTSAYLAKSVNTSASFVRRIMAKLSKAGLVRTTMGKDGACWLGRDAKDISLLDIYQAVSAPKVFAIHKYPADKHCVVSSNIKPCLGRILAEVQQSTETSGCQSHPKGLLMTYLTQTSNGLLLKLLMTVLPNTRFCAMSIFNERLNKRASSLG